MTNENSKDVIEFQGIKLRPALAWIVLTAANSPCDCYIQLKQANHYLIFQKKGTATRKNLFQVFMKAGVFEIFVTEEQYRFYVDLVDQVLNSNFANEKLTQFKQHQQLFNLLFPEKAALPYNVQKMMNELGLKLDASSKDSIKEKIKFPEYPKDIDLVKFLYEDIDLSTASMEKVVDNTDKIEIENLRKKLSAANNQIEQYADAIKDNESELAQSELEIRKGIEELSKIQGELNKLNDDHEDLKRKHNIMKNELDDLLSGQKDAKQIFAGRIASLEKRLEEVRAETQDFKLKYAREIDKNKELQRSLSQAQTNLSKTAAALKKVTTPKSA